MFHYCGPVQIAGPLLPLQFTALEQGVRFKIDMSAGYSQGIFLDQRDHRRRVREKSAPGMRVLNTFAYTGAFSVYAALGGAQTTTLDLAQGRAPLAGKVRQAGANLSRHYSGPSHVFPG